MLKMGDCVNTPTRALRIGGIATVPQSNEGYYHVGLHLHDDASYEYGDFCIRLHRGDAAFTPIRFHQKRCTLLQLLNSTRMIFT